MGFQVQKPSLHASVPGTVQSFSLFNEEVPSRESGSPNSCIVLRRVSREGPETFNSGATFHAHPSVVLDLLLILSKRSYGGRPCNHSRLHLSKRLPIPKMRTRLSCGPSRETRLSKQGIFNFCSKPRDYLGTQRLKGCVPPSGSR